ncbi:hypothetical protein MTO96_028939 [Rhipicephalus appendiculatus]
MVERHNGTVKECLRAYCTNHKEWDSHIPEIAFALRTAESVVTGFTPAFLCYGRELRTSWEPPGTKDNVEPPAAAYHAFSEEVRQCLAQALEFTHTQQVAAQAKQKAHYDHHRRPVTLKPGDLVLLDSHTLSEMHYQLEDAKPKFVFCELREIPKVKQACKDVASVEAIIAVNGTCEEALSLSELKKTELTENETLLSQSPDTTLCILYSSGTTGLPKGVQLTHRNIIAQVIAYG